MPSYKQVFGVDPGSDLKEGQGVNFLLCPAATALRSILGCYRFFGVGKLQGQGPLWRPDNKTRLPSHAYTRHHAGTAVDIMLNEKSDPEVALGQHLVSLFEKFQSVMRWRSLIYQDYTNNPGDSTHLTPTCWSNGAHYDHIHIDWFDSKLVNWDKTITTVTLQNKNGSTLDLLVNTDGLATNIDWPSAANTDFRDNVELLKAVSELMAKFHAGELKKAVLGDQVCTVPVGVTKLELAGTWEANVNGWKGIFVFDAGGGVSWADSAKSTKHSGSWTATNSEVTWKFKDAGDIRTFKATLPLNRTKTSGIILPDGQGSFEMRKL
jgi:hypothetical protein